MFMAALLMITPNSKHKCLSVVEWISGKQYIYIMEYCSVIIKEQTTNISNLDNHPGLGLHPGMPITDALLSSWDRISISLLSCLWSFFFNSDSLNLVSRSPLTISSETRVALVYSWRFLHSPSGSPL